MPSERGKKEKMVEVMITRDKKGRETVKGQRILIDGKEIRLQFTMPIWYKMEEEICILDDLYTMMHSKERFQEGNIPALIALMSGGTFTAAEIREKADPAAMRALMREANNVISRAVEMKEKKYEDNSVHDEVLEEIEKKEPGAD